MASRAPLEIALINLHARSDNWTETIMVPLGLMYLASALRTAFGDRVSVSVHDMTVTPKDVGLEESVERYLHERQPDVVGVRGFSTQADEFGPVARCAKRVNPDCLVVAGGPHASTRSPSLFAEREIDLVAPQEGEETIVEIVADRLAGRDPRATPGVGYLGDGGPAFAPPRAPIEDLDAIPLPDYGVIDLDRYQGAMTMTSLPPRRRFTSLFTSRGCHYRCIYCHDNFGKRVRYRSVDNVLAEMRLLIEEHGVREFHVVDDIFNADRRRAIDIFDGIVRAGWDIDIAFPNGLRADIMREDFVAAGRAAGAYYWALAVETATPRLQKMVKKFNRLDKVFETIALSARYGVITATFNMLGFPTETEEEMAATIRFNLDSDAHIAHFFKVTPFEGTGLWDQARETGVVPPGDLALGYATYAGDQVDQLSEVPASRIQALIVDFYRRFYFDPARLQRLCDLVARGHDPAQFGVFLEDRLRSVGVGIDGVGNPRSAELLRRLLRMAGRTASAAVG